MAGRQSFCIIMSSPGGLVMRTFIKLLTIGEVCFALIYSGIVRLHFRLRQIESWPLQFLE